MGTFQDAIKFINLNRLDGFNIRSGTSAEAMIFKYDDGESKEDNISRAEQVMAVTPGRFFTLTGWCGKNQSRGTFQFQFSNEVQQAPQWQQQQQAQIGAVDENYINERIQTAIAGVRAEYDKRDLEKREAELRDERKAFEEDRNSVIGVLINKLAPMIKAATQRSHLSVAGIDGDEQRQIEHRNSAAEQQREQEEEKCLELPDTVCDLIVRWQAVEPDFERVLEKIVTMAEAGDSNYTFAKTALLK